MQDDKLQTDKPQTELKAQPAVLRATISIVRANTGKVETFDLVGTPQPVTEKEAP